MLNDRMLGALGIDPVTASIVASSLIKIGSGIFGRSSEFLERQKRYDAIDEITDHYWALMPNLPDYLKPVVEKDVRELMQRNVDSKTVEDLDRALNWFSGREQAWNLISPSDITAANGVHSPYERRPLSVKDAVKYVTTPEGDIVSTFDVRPPAFETAGFPWWIGALILGGLVIGPKLLKGR
jgi:hypothetical protein